jgi:hypothetical protein
MDTTLFYDVFKPVRTCEIKRVIDWHGVQIGQKLVIEYPDEEYYKLLLGDRRYLCDITNDFITKIGYAIDTFNEYIEDLNEKWDEMHPEDMMEGTQLYNDYGHYILDFYSRVCHELNCMQNEAADWAFYARMIGADPIWAARLRVDPNVTIHLEYYDPAKE